MFNLAMIEAAFPTEDTPLSPVSYRFQQSMPPDVRYGNCNNDFLQEASKMTEFQTVYISCGPRILKCHYIQPNHELKIPFMITKTLAQWILFTFKSFSHSDLRSP